LDRLDRVGIEIEIEVVRNSVGNIFTKDPVLRLGVEQVVDVFFVLMTKL